MLGAFFSPLRSPLTSIIESIDAFCGLFLRVCSSELGGVGYHI